MKNYLIAIFIIIGALFGMIMYPNKPKAASMSTEGVTTRTAVIKPKNDSVIDTVLSFCRLVKPDVFRVSTYVFLNCKKSVIISSWRAGGLPEDSTLYITIRRYVHPELVKPTLLLEKTQAIKILKQKKDIYKLND